MIEHRGLVNYSVDAARLFGLSQSDTVLQQNTLNFDLSVEEIFRHSWPVQPWRQAARSSAVKALKITAFTRPSCT